MTEITNQPDQFLVNQVPQTKVMNALMEGPQLNVRSNIIAGPGDKDYWYHSPGAQVPMIIPEEGPFPVQGNIGSLLKLGPSFSSCEGPVNGSNPNIGSSPNCTGVFIPDTYTVEDTCGSQCKMKYPESYGLKDFGFGAGTNPDNKITNAHQIHAFQNLRAGMAGQMDNNGCYEWIPRLTPNASTGACELNQKPVYSQVGPWNKLKRYSNIQDVKYKI